MSRPAPDRASTAAAAPIAASVRREGAALVFAGALDRGACAALWQQVQPLLDGSPATLELAAVSVVDSAGLALLAEIAARTGTAVNGAPPGLAELRAAYRLDAALDYAR